MVICINWGSYIWAVNNGHLIDSSLGYYINPIIVIILGTSCFKERLSVREWYLCFFTGKRKKNRCKYFERNQQNKIMPY